MSRIIDVMEQFFDDNGNVFLQGDGFKSEKEAAQWLRDLHSNIASALWNKQFDIKIKK